MSTKYTNLSIQVISRPADPDRDVSEAHQVLISVHFVNALPRIKGQKRPVRGQVWAKVFQFMSRDDAESARGMLEQAFDAMLPICIQPMVLLPVDEEEAARTIIVPGG